MDLQELLKREPPKPWSHGGKIPWHEPGFSERMLREHLSQDHDLASRRSAKIDAQVEWLSQEILPDRASVLDLGCGPGLYTSRLASLGAFLPEEAAGRLAGDLGEITLEEQALTAEERRQLQSLGYLN